MARNEAQKRTIQEYRNGTAKIGRYYDAFGNSHRANTLEDETALTNLLNKHFKSYSVSEDGFIKGHADADGGPHKTWQRAADAYSAEVGDWMARPRAEIPRENQARAQSTATAPSSTAKASKASTAARAGSHG